MRDHPATPRTPERKSWLGRFLGLEVILNDRRRQPRGPRPRRVAAIGAGVARRLVRAFRRRGGPRPWARGSQRAS